MTPIDLAERRRRFRGGPTAPRVIAEFQPDAAEIEDRAPPRATRTTLYVVAALIVAAVVWASLSTVDRVVTARGRLITIQPNIVVQPLETSVIRQIHVAVGDVVHREQPLATLDPTFPKADVDALRIRIAALDATIARLEAELSGRDFVAPDPTDPDDRVEARLFAQRKAYYAASLHNFDAQIAGAQAELQTNKAEAAVTSRRLDTLRSIETMRSELVDKEVGSRLNLLLSRDARLEAEDSLSHLRGTQVELTDKLARARAERQTFIEDFWRDALKDLVDARAKRNAAAEDLKKAALRQHMIVLRTPVDAVVLDIAHRSVGSVMREAETLFTLVPRDAALQAEVDVESKDIGDIAVGQRVKLKFDAFPFQKYGTGTGTVRVISPDSFAPVIADEGTDRAPRETEKRPTQPFYRVLVTPTNVHLHGLPKGFRMMPGMTLSAELQVGRRRVISYFLYPLLRGLDESIREP